MFIEDIRAAESRGDLAHAAQLKTTLRHFIEEHLAKPRTAPDRDMKLVDAAPEPRRQHGRGDGEAIELTRSQRVPAGRPN